jgi:hypothetical protein
LLLVSSGAFADKNKAYLVQDGSANSGGIYQNSDATAGNQAGISSDQVTQTGPNNKLTITQNGDGGKIGVKTGTDDYFTPEHPYDGGAGTPQYSITYAGVDQISTGTASNKADLTQNGANSVIGELQQNASGSANGNTVISTQYDANTINHILQVQDAGAAKNVATITEGSSVGGFTGNVIDRLDQHSNGAGGANTITVDIEGNNNGVVNDHGLGGFYSSKAWYAGATQSALIQGYYGNQAGIVGSTGSGNPTPVYGNSIDLKITGSSNQYGMTQKGTNNSGGQIVISGSNNYFGSYQAGQGNVISAGEIEGDNNQVGIWQIGSTNHATLSVIASGSNFNELSILQGGTNNDATLTVSGSFNGSHAFQGVAATLVSTSPLDSRGAPALSNGTILQGGYDIWETASGNDANVTINGDNNAFAVAQLGSNNDVTGNVGTPSTTSSFNSAAVLQQGSSNTASFTQTGSGNMAAISQ